MTGDHRTFPEVTAELDRRRFISMGFERIEALLAALGNAERSLRVVQVVGTNGKGTTSVALSAALEVMGETTGTYLSPHVMSYAERVRVRGEQVTEEAFAEGMGKVISVADENGIEVTQFELLTAGALAMFRDAGVRWAVMEAGLGARYDATTAARPEAVVLTNVALDHMEYLGDSIAEIATEKLASVPENGTFVLGTDDPEVGELARETCRIRNATLVTHPPDGHTPYTEQDISLGIFAAGKLLGAAQPPLDGASISCLRSSVRGVLPGRMDVRNLDGTTVILDGGHNPAGIQAALRAVQSEYPAHRIGVVFGVLGDKDIQSMLDEVRKCASMLVLTKPESERAAEPVGVAAKFQPTDVEGGRARVEEDIGDAIMFAADTVEKSWCGEGVVLVTGSLYTVATALGWFEKRSRS